MAPPKRVRIPGARLAEATSPSVRVRSLLGLAEDLLARTEIDRRPLALADALAARGDGSSVSIAEAAADFAYSPRRLRRLSAQWYGYGPKHLAKILRWRRARALIDAGLTRTEAAARSGVLRCRAPVARGAGAAGAMIRSAVTPFSSGRRRGRPCCRPGRR
ncbi:hypothetical protein IOD13_18525 [Brevibacterium casei]|nr:hypothetical protein [Brevibacterium casei]